MTIAGLLFSSFSGVANLWVPILRTIPIGHVKADQVLAARLNIHNTIRLGMYTLIQASGRAISHCSDSTDRKLGSGIPWKAKATGPRNDSYPCGPVINSTQLGHRNNQTLPKNKHRRKGAKVNQATVPVPGSRSRSLSENQKKRSHHTAQQRSNPGRRPCERQNLRLWANSSGKFSFLGFHYIVLQGFRHGHARLHNFGFRYIVLEKETKQNTQRKITEDIAVDERD